MIRILVKASDMLEATSWLWLVPTLGSPILLLDLDKKSTTQTLRVFSCYRR
jgi:hypothetical protein